MSEASVDITTDSDASVVPESPELKQERPRNLPFNFSKRHGVLVDPEVSEPTKVLCQSQPALVVMAEVQRFLACPVFFERVEDAEFKAKLSLAYESDSDEAIQMVEGLGDDMDLASLADSVPETEDLLDQQEDAPIIRLINALLTEAIKVNASDIHIETFEKQLVVRFRVDGVLREMVKPKRALAPLLVSRIKVMAKLDIAEKRVPQDGRISLRVGGREVDIRVSTIPASNGERVVLRLLDKQAGRLNLSSLGMADRDSQALDSLLQQPHGILLVTGPTGSGKTTSLYAGLSRLNDKTRNILTVEDPIEYNLEGIGQTQVNTKADMTFARGLRAILRQDPDVVMIGEIRDLETAEIAVQASLTGHLVLSTLHTNNAIGAVTRLHDMGVEPFLLSSSLVGVVAQRLVRVLCPSCKQAHEPDIAEREKLHLHTDETTTIYRPGGCDQCNNTGYRGRAGIFEVIVIDDTMRTLIHNRAAESELIEYARQQGPSIRADGRARVLAGLTSLEELLRVTQEG
ncbi:MAG: type II secretion system ATPase GspE [Pseudomonadales bacterium]